MTDVQPKSDQVNTAAIRRDLTERIIRNLKQVQEYLTQLESELSDPDYQVLAGDRKDWEQKNQDLQEQVGRLQDLFNEVRQEQQQTNREADA